MEAALNSCRFISDGENQLCVVGIEDYVESVVSDNGCKRGHVGVEEGGAQGRALWDSAADLCRFGGEWWEPDTLGSASEEGVVHSSTLPWMKAFVESSAEGVVGDCRRL